MVTTTDDTAPTEESAPTETEIVTQPSETTPATEAPETEVAPAEPKTHFLLTPAGIVLLVLGGVLIVAVPVGVVAYCMLHKKKED